ncbi:hypothetical protein PROFUN_06988 [Planoprotostelium fungivorum]|uniref:Carbohydrate-binding module family 96 domain-containing protein n=1 Tax=Planoprotostelium fungivorum TaxID=1890364 RepID=A0A2P6NMU1_9EUKA|nr:hypothetical protein PROFUN_06988 [Planoprotostelium fungivorum]
MKQVELMLFIALLCGQLVFVQANMSGMVSYMSPSDGNMLCFKDTSSMHVRKMTTQHNDGPSTAYARFTISQGSIEGVGRAELNCKIRETSSAFTVEISSVETPKWSQSDNSCDDQPVSNRPFATVELSEGATSLSADVTTDLKNSVAPHMYGLSFGATEDTELELYDCNIKLY